jgi:hypothetical protein
MFSFGVQGLPASGGAEGDQGSGFSIRSATRSSLRFDLRVEGEWGSLEVLSRIGLF